MLKVLQKRKFRILLACISLLLLVNMVQDTYAKYVSSADANSHFAIARWNFTVNNQDIIANNDFSNTIVPTWDSNDHIEDGVIAPTSTGYFELTIDSSNVGVSFDQTITLSPGTTNSVSDIIITGYTLNDGPLVTIANTNTSTITSTHLLGEETTVNTYKFFIKWNDDAATEQMNNAADTAASVEGTANVHINLNFIQKASN